MSTIQAYRSALRATKLAFRNDVTVLESARAKIKEGILEHKDLVGDAMNVEINKLNEVSKFLTMNIVQGQLQEDGRYYLNFHDKTELGDNETIKQGKKHDDMGSLAGKKPDTFK